MKKYSLMGMLLVSAFAAFAQADSTSRLASHYLGVQGNQLIRQIFNFNNSNSSINNPYLLVYSINNKVSGHGVNIGLGYSLNEVSDGDLSSKRESSLSNLSMRIGWERKKMIGRRWIASYGVDLTFLSNKNETTVSTESNFSKSKIITENSSSGMGLGPRITLNYQFTSRLIVGTEINYYFTRQKNKSEINSSITSQQWNPNTGQMEMMTTDDTEENEDKTKRFELNPPVAIFLIMKL